MPQPQPQHRKVIQFAVVPLAMVTDTSTRRTSEEQAQQTAMVALLDDGSLWRCVVDLGESYSTPVWSVMATPI